MFSFQGLTGKENKAMKILNIHLALSEEMTDFH